ncbi:MAG: hypothetical protein UV75_C0020G0002 [Candidatus Giovannonibacteria bacterium GW2011_GWA1_43_15]|nr:MAG: hypothetical protein UV75_C0020G0002 [Candidatus Giovannonibacteria bacterium GW2011_GWA1_43_15]
MISLIQSKKKKKVVIAAFIVAFLALTSTSAYFYFLKKPSQTVQNPPENQITHPPCLGDNEIADFLVDEKFGFKYPKFPIIVSVKDKNTSKEKFHFQIDNVSKNYHSVEIHKCGVYAIREFNYDDKKTKQDPGYKEEIWKYDYNGKGESLVLLTEKPKEFISYYDGDFRVDPMEIYIALVRSYSEIPENIGYYFKNQQTREDSFTLSYPSILKISPDIDGYLGLENWTKSGSYFWGDIFAGAPRLGFVRIKRDSWEYDVLPAPAGTLGGTAFNPEFGYLTYNTGPGWIGIDVITEQVHDEWRKAGKIVEFHLYNLFTKDDILLATSTEPSWNGKPQWLSDTELQYELSTGEKKIYKIKESE